MSRSPGPLALAIAGLALLQALLSAWLAVRIWTGGVALPQDNPLATLHSLAYAGSALLTLIWMARAVGRVTRAGAVDLSAGPVMAVLWWFVPLANLVMRSRSLRSYAAPRSGRRIGTGSVEAC